MGLLRAKTFRGEASPLEAPRKFQGTPGGHRKTPRGSERWLCARPAAVSRQFASHALRGSARDGGVYSDKKQQIRWCLAEAVMDKGRQILRDASAIAVTRDERKGRLLIRWRACTPNLTSASGVLSFHPVDGSAEDLAESTRKLCKNTVGFAFVCLVVLRIRSRERTTQQRKQTLRKKHPGILVTDGAAPEVLASGLLSGRRPYAKSSSCETYMEGVKVISRDTPHASTRLLKRPFKASPELDKLMTEYVSGTDSFAQKVFHSPMLTTWWKELVTEDNDGLTSMCAAKHRFASYFIPLSRIAHNFPSVVKLCQKVAYHPCIWGRVGVSPFAAAVWQKMFARGHGC